ncbi:MAG: hypothetical protein AAGG44_06080 [Planctomycetota bacterium]
MFRPTFTTATLIAFLGIASQASAEQFILFDVQFRYTKSDADNSKPSKSHFYVKEHLLNPKRPTDWTSPVDYRNGSVHLRLEVLDKPKGEAATTWSVCYIPYEGIKEGYGCLGTPIYTQTGVFEKDIPMDKFWQNDRIVWNKGIRQMDLVIKDDSGGQGHAHKRDDHELFFPTTVRMTAIQVAKGSKYDPAILKNSKPKSGKAITTPEKD